jgi:hypothetical protein
VASIGAASALILVPSTASARDLDYRATDGCPDRAVVAARIEALSPEGRSASIDIRSTKSGFHGQLVLGTGEDRVERNVDAHTCSAVVDALVLVVSLDREDVEAPAADKPSPPVAAATAESASVAPQARDAGPTPTTGRSSIGTAFGATFLTTSFAQNEKMLGAMLFAEIAAAESIAGWFRPSARGSFMWTTTPTWTERNGIQPDFTILGGALDGCLSTREDSIVVSACSRTQFASLAASTTTGDKSSHSRAWFATGAIGRARVAFMNHGDVRPILELSGGLLAPVVRDRFHFDGHDPVVAAPWIWTAEIGGGVALR